MVALGHLFFIRELLVLTALIVLRCVSRSCVLFPKNFNAGTHRFSLLAHFFLRLNQTTSNETATA